jgi:hypothetical protein
VSPKKGDPIAPPTIGAEWRIRYSTNDAIKGRQDLETHAPADLRAIQGRLNDRPRKILGWRTPGDVLREELAS